MDNPTSSTDPAALTAEERITGSIGVFAGCSFALYISSIFKTSRRKMLVAQISL
jgi:hypothetical protein